LTLNNIGELEQVQGRYPEALEAYEQALVIIKEVADPAGEGALRNNLGRLYRLQGQPEEALASFQKALAIFEAIRTAAGSDAGRTGFIAQYSATYQVVVDLLYQQGQPEAAFLVTEQGRARSFLDSLVTGRVQLSDTGATELLAQEREDYARRQAAQDALAKARALRPPQPELVRELESQLAGAERAYEAMQQRLAARGDDLASLIPGRSPDYVLGVRQVQQRLAEKTTLLSYYILEDRVLAFLISKREFQVIPLSVSPTQLASQITAFRDFGDIEKAHPASLISLYDWLIEPLKPYLPDTPELSPAEGGANPPASSGERPPQLMIIPHGALHYLPFAALTDGERYLIDDYSLTVLPSASALPFIQENARQTADQPLPSPLILGNPATGDFDTTAVFATTRDQLGSLPFAEKEARRIGQLYEVVPLTGIAATESALEERVPRAGILHLAAHGFYNPVTPLSSLIALAPDKENDGWLTVGEVYGLDLDQTDLVVLSACETQLGQKGFETGLGVTAGDEVVGLTRAFIFAGTPSVLASLWKVEDEATSLLMERFYTHLQAGMGKAEALRQAQLEVRAEYPNPYYWAAFILSGDPGTRP
jgi:CHAT domain-containing protein